MKNMRLKSRRLSLMLVLGWACMIHSTGAQDLVDQYPFLKLDQNQLDFYGDSTIFNRFFGRLDRVILDGEGQVNILHMGGSHVQGGSLSHTMRTHMQSFAPGLRGQRGLIFPFTLAGTNNPYNYVVKKYGAWEGARVSVSHHHSEWGISGITATANSPSSSMSVYARNAEDAFGFTKARIFYNQCECAFTPIVNNTHQDEVRIDSLAGFLEVSFLSPQDTLYLSFRKDTEEQTQFILQGIQLLTDGPGVVYNPIGVNGAKTDDYLRSQSLPDHLKMIVPDLVIFGIGINDAHTYARTFDQEKYESNYRELIRLMREANPEVAILFMTNNDSYFQGRYPNPNAYKVRESMIRVAKEENAAVWDLFEIMGGLDAIRLWDSFGLAASDRIHFTRRGYVLQADLLFAAIKAAYGDYLSARFQNEP